MKEYIYALVVEENTQFYIGRTNNLARRLGEHQRLSRYGHEEKYVCIRALDCMNVQWRMEIIAVLEDMCEHYEDYYIYQALLDDQPLMNMKAGDKKRSTATRRAEAAMLRNRTRYESAEEFLVARQMVITKMSAKSPQPHYTDTRTPFERLFTIQEPVRGNKYKRVYGISAARRINTNANSTYACIT